MKVVDITRQTAGEALITIKISSVEERFFLAAGLKILMTEKDRDPYLGTIDSYVNDELNNLPETEVDNPAFNSLIEIAVLDALNKVCIV